MSIHIEAEVGEISESILLPGDPLRAKWIAENFLEDTKCYNEVRGMLGYTGTYKGQRVSVQGTGMGIPSALIYCHGLVDDYAVYKLIRVGSAFSYQKNVTLWDHAIAIPAASRSGITNNGYIHGDYSPAAYFEPIMMAAHFAKENNIP